MPAELSDTAAPSGARHGKRRRHAQSHDWACRRALWLRRSSTCSL